MKKQKEDAKLAGILKEFFASGDKESIFFLALDCKMKREEEEAKDGPEHAKCLYFIEALKESGIKDKKFIGNIKKILTEDE